jgi:hypothetical protein
MSKQLLQKKASRQGSTPSKIQSPAKSAALPAVEQEVQADLQTSQVERANKLGHNFGKLMTPPASSPVIRPKLTIGQSRDNKYEPQEEVLQMKPLTKIIQHVEMPSEVEKVQIKPTIQRNPNTMQGGEDEQNLLGNIPEEILRQQFALLLHLSQERGVTHEDIKSHNQMMIPQGIGKVTDLGSY